MESTTLVSESGGVGQPGTDMPKKTVESVSGTGSFGVVSSQPPSTSTKQLTMSTGGRDGRLVIGGVKAGNANGPRVFLLSTIKTPSSGPGGVSDSGGVLGLAGSRVSLLKADGSSRSGTISSDCNGIVGNITKHFHSFYFCNNN